MTGINRAQSLEACLEIAELQLRNMFGLEKSELSILRYGVQRAYRHTLNAASLIANKYWRKDTVNPFCADQWSFLLYWTARLIFLEYGRKNIDLLDKLYYLNRALNSVDLYYEINLPQKFFPQHPIGTILGRAVYGDCLTFYQGCTVGQSRSGSPSIGDHVILFSGSKVLGNCKLGENVIVSANTYLLDVVVPPLTLVFGQPRDYIFKSIDKQYYFNLSPFLEMS